MMNETALTGLAVAFAVVVCGAAGMPAMPAILSAASYCCLPTNANAEGTAPVAAVAAAAVGLQVASPAFGVRAAVRPRGGSEHTPPPLSVLRC